MRKITLRVFVAMYAIFLLYGINPNADAKIASGLSNFSTDKANYSSGQFSDVNETAWYGTNNQGTIKKVIELGIMCGTGNNSFEPTDNITVAQAIKMASVVHNIYHGSNVNFVQGKPWYQVYVDYAIDNNIITCTDFSDYDADISRSQMAYLFTNAIPKREFNTKNKVQILPDVTSNTEHSDNIFLLYRAGVLMGSDEFGTFNPNSKIERCQAAAIIARTALESERSTFTLKPAVSKIDLNKNWIYDQYSNKFYDRFRGTVSYQVPGINIISTDARKTNMEINSYYMKYINNKDYYGILNNISYTYYENGDLLSLVIEMNFGAGDQIHYKTYNISKYTGKLVPQNELLSNKEISNEVYLNNAKVAIGDKFLELYSGCEKIASNYQEQYNKSISPDNVTMDMPMFLDEDGTISVVGRIWAIAGAGYYYHVIDTNL